MGELRKIRQRCCPQVAHIWKVNRQSHCMWEVLQSTLGARGGKEVKEGFLELESLLARKFQDFKGGEMIIIII